MDVWLIEAVGDIADEKKDEDAIMINDEYDEVTLGLITDEEIIEEFEMIAVVLSKLVTDSVEVDGDGLIVGVVEVFSSLSAPSLFDTIDVITKTGNSVAVKPSRKKFQIISDYFDNNSNT